MKYDAQRKLYTFSSVIVRSNTFTGLKYNNDSEINFNIVLFFLKMIGSFLNCDAASISTKNASLIIARQTKIIQARK